MDINAADKLQLETFHMKWQCWFEYITSLAHVNDILAQYHCAILGHDTCLGNHVPDNIALYSQAHLPYCTAVVFSYWFDLYACM